jgi:hypothetical protein
VRWVEGRARPDAFGFTVLGFDFLQEGLERGFVGGVAGQR